MRLPSLRGAVPIVPAARLRGVNRTVVPAKGFVELLSDGALSLYAFCFEGEGGEFDQASLVLEVDGSTAIWDSVSSFGADGGELEDGDFAEIGRTPDTLGGTAHAGGTINTVAVNGRALHIGFEQQGANSPGGSCVFSASAISE